MCSVTDSDFGDLHTVMYRTPGSVLFSELHARVDPNGSMRRVSQTWYRENVLLEEKQGGTGQSAGAGWEQLDSQLRGPYAVYNSQWDACMAGLQDFTGLWNLAGMLKRYVRTKISALLVSEISSEELSSGKQLLAGALLCIIHDSFGTTYIPGKNSGVDICTCNIARHWANT